MSRHHWNRKVVASLLPHLVTARNTHCSIIIEMECGHHHYWPTHLFLARRQIRPFNIHHTFSVSKTFEYLFGNLKYRMEAVGLPDSSTAMSCTPGVSVRTTGPAEGAPHYPTALCFHFYPSPRRRPALRLTVALLFQYFRPGIFVLII